MGNPLVRRVKRLDGWTAIHRPGRPVELVPPRKNPILYRFQLHRGRAKYQGIGFELSFEQWLKVWTDSGHLNDSGRQKGSYMMVRKNHKLPFKKGNVKIVKKGEHSFL